MRDTLDGDLCPIGDPPGDPSDLNARRIAGFCAVVSGTGEWKTIVAMKSPLPIPDKIERGLNVCKAF